MTDSNRVCKMSRAEIVSLFDSYQFKDALGHDLLCCADFTCLLSMAMEFKAIAALLRPFVKDTLEQLTGSKESGA